MTKDQRTIKEQAVQITDLTNKVARLESDLESTRKYKEQYDDELSDIHATFDLLGIPRCVKNSYRNMSANARLTLFLAQTNGIKVEQPKEE
jgi:hypothetical protein